MRWHAEANVCILWWDAVGSVGCILWWDAVGSVGCGGKSLHIVVGCSRIGGMRWDAVGCGGYLAVFVGDDAIVGGRVLQRRLKYKSIINQNGV